MKRFIATTSPPLPYAGAAYDDTTVTTRQEPDFKGRSRRLPRPAEAAVKRECYKATGPLIGVAAYTYRGCIKDTRAVVAKTEPTGLYAKRDSPAGVAIAAK